MSSIGPQARVYVMHGAFAQVGWRLCTSDGSTEPQGLPAASPSSAFIRSSPGPNAACRARLGAHRARQRGSVLDVVYADGELSLEIMDLRARRTLRASSPRHAWRAHVSVPIVVTILADVLYGLHAAHEATDENGDPLGMCIATCRRRT
jgi:hypothetical protein